MNVLSAKKSMSSRLTPKFYCYIQCVTCEEMVSKKVKMTREHLEYSMLCFLMHMLKASQESSLSERPFTKKQSKQISKKESLISSKLAATCQHHDKMRVF